MRNPRHLIPIGLLTVLAAWPAASHAATVKADEFCDAGVDTPCEEILEYTATPGEINKVTVTVLSPTSYRVDDPSANLTPTSADCAANGAHQVTCATTRAFSDVDVSLGDGDDTYSANTPVSGILEAGAGNDVVDGGSGSEHLDGGGGIDTLRGNGGNDSLRDGDTDAAHDADTLDGGAGADVVDYILRSQDVKVNLAAPNAAGASGENDKLSGVEGAQGGNGDDTLTGDGGDNELRGGQGDDVLDGKGGDDDLADATVMKGGAGNDTLSRLNKGGTLTCGSGADVVGADVPARKVPVDCETVVADETGTFIPTLLTSRGPLEAAKNNRFVFRFRCTKQSDFDCSGKVSVQVGGKTIASGKLPATAKGKRREISLAFPAKIAKKVRGKGVNATFTFKRKGGRSEGYTTLMRV